MHVIMIFSDLICMIKPGWRGLDHFCRISLVLDSSRVALTISIAFLGAAHDDLDVFITGRTSIIFPLLLRLLFNIFFSFLDLSLHSLSFLKLQNLSSFFFFLCLLVDLFLFLNGFVHHRICINDSRSNLRMMNF